MDHSIAACTQILVSRKAANPAVPITNRGHAWQAKEDFDRAIADYNEAIRIDPKYSYAYNGRGNTFWRKGDFDRAIADFNESIRLNPKDPEPYANRGNAWSEKKEFDRAIIDFNAAIRIAPKWAGPLNNRALAWRSKGEFDRAIDDFTAAIVLDPMFATAYSNRGEAWRMKGDLDRALIDQNRSIELDRKNGTNFVVRGDTLRYKGEFARALADYDTALRGRPDNVPAMVSKGLTYERLGDETRARIEFEKAIASKNPQRSDVFRSSLETARARLLALDSGAPQPVIPSALSKTTSITTIPAPAAIVPVAPPSATVQGRRVALVVGNSNYKKVKPLSNPPHDADAIAATFRAIGFQTVTLMQDATRDTLLDTLRKFAVEAETADWAVVYYAGHGIEMNGINYLIPVDAKLEVDRDVQFEAIPVDQVLLSVEGAKKLKLILLDACRDNPFTPTMRHTAAPDAISASTGGATVGRRSIGRGLGEVKVTGATLVAFAAKNGQTALDGEGDNSPFAVALTQRIATPGVEINKVFRLVRDDVMEATAGRQEPYTYGSLPGKEDFFFVAK